MSSFVGLFLQLDSAGELSRQAKIDAAWWPVRCSGCEPRDSTCGRHPGAALPGGHPCSGGCLLHGGRDVYAGFIGSASCIAGNDYLLPAIAAAVVGGTPFSGGKGSIIASGVAALFLSQLGQLVLSMGASTAVQLLVQAGAIIIAVTIPNRRLLPSETDFAVACGVPVLRRVQKQSCARSAAISPAKAAKRSSPCPSVARISAGEVST